MTVVSGASDIVCRPFRSVPASFAVAWTCLPLPLRLQPVPAAAAAAAVPQQMSLCSQI